MDQLNSTGQSHPFMSKGAPQYPDLRQSRQELCVCKPRNANAFDKVRMCECVCVCVCVRERERERERRDSHWLLLARRLLLR